MDSDFKGRTGCCFFTLRRKRAGICVARFIPVLGTVIDHHYDRISECEFFSTLGIDSICLAATTSKAISSAKQASTAKFARNLNARFNQTPYNPRAMASLLKARYPETEIVSHTMPRTNAKNVKLAGNGKTITLGMDKLTEEPIIKHFPFN